jgi:hypothetical protein
MIAALGHSSADATYFARILLVFIFAISSVIVVAGPKVAKAILLRKNPTLQTPKGRVSMQSLLSKQSQSQLSISSCHYSGNSSLNMSRDSMPSSCQSEK